MDIKNAILAIIVIITIVYIIQTICVSEKSISDPILLEADKRIKHILAMNGYRVKYNMKIHPNATFTKNKTEMNICKSCVYDKNSTSEIEETIPILDKVVYMGLHEAAHVVNVYSKDSHDEVWKNLFKSLLVKATELGYLDKNLLRF